MESASRSIAVDANKWYFPVWLDKVLPRVGLESEDALPDLPAPAPSRQELARSRAG